jgi:hypothetical protein
MKHFVLQNLVVTLDSFTFDEQKESQPNTQSVLFDHF